MKDAETAGEFGSMILSWKTWKQLENIVRRWHEAPRIEKGSVAGVVVTVDTFGNLITNIDAALVNEIEQPVVLAGGQQFPMWENRNLMVMFS